MRSSLYIYSVDVGHCLLGQCLLNKMQITRSLKPILNYQYKTFFITGICILKFVILHLGRRKERGI